MKLKILLNIAISYTVVLLQIAAINIKGNHAMDEPKKMIKTDINFLEWPNWVLNQRSTKGNFTIQKERGTYELISGLPFPTHFDKIVLYYLLYRLYRETAFECCALNTMRYEIAKSIYDTSHLGTTTYTRIMKSLERWKAISIKFKGVFYEGEQYTYRMFSIIDDFTLYEDTGKLEISFNKLYIKQLKETQFYRYIDFNKFKLLRSGLAARLYEIEAKSFHEKDEWAIGLDLLAEKLTMEHHVGTNRYYPSEVLRKLKPAQNEICRNTDLYANMAYNKATRILVFKKMQKPKQYIPALADKPKKQSNEKDIEPAIKHS